MSFIVAVSELMLLAGVSASPFYFSWRNGRSKSWLKKFLPDDGAETKRIQSLYGYSEHSLIGISGDGNVWIDKKNAGAVCYKELGKIWLVAGEPLASEENLINVTREFLQTARTKRKLVVFLPATERFALAAAAENLKTIKVGAAPYFDLRNWNPRGNKAKNLRSGLNQAQRAGISVRQVEKTDEEFKREACKLGENWLQSRRAGVKFGWLFRFAPFENAEVKKFFAARRTDGTLVGVLAASPIPARDGWYLEDVVREPDAPNGTADMLVFEALTKLAEQGAMLATLGTVPLSEKGSDKFSSGGNALLKRILKSSRKNMTSIYNFEGLQCFKSKFVPSWWENEYILVQKGFFPSLLTLIALFYAIIPDGLGGIIKSIFSE